MCTLLLIHGTNAARERNGQREVDELFSDVPFWKEGGRCCITVTLKEPGRYKTTPEDDLTYMKKDKGMRFLGRHVATLEAALVI